ncbi:MAG: hypothetical protein ACTSQP_18415 [Promethearchaeota archaeon]
MWKEFTGKDTEQNKKALNKQSKLVNIFRFKIPEYDYDPKAEETMENLMGYDYSILRNNMGREFYTSDHPIIQFDLSEKAGIKVAILLAPDLFLILNKGKEWMQIYLS